MVRGVKMMEVLEVDEGAEERSWVLQSTWDSFITASAETKRHQERVTRATLSKAKSGPSCRHMDELDIGR